MSKKLFSIIIPTRNEEKYIVRTLKKVLSQKISREKIEIIICDAKSKDKTVKLSRKYADKLIVKKTHNPSEGRNIGGKKAKGEILVFLDADTHLPDNGLKIINEKIEQGFVAGTFLVRFEDQDWVDSIILTVINFGEALLDLLGINMGNGNCIFIKKNVFNNINGFNSKMDVGEDHEFIRRASKHGRIALISDKMIISPRRVRSEGWPKVLKSWFKGLLSHSKKISEKGYWEDYKK